MLCVTNNKLLCGNASGQVNQQSVTIQADKPPGFVDKEKWLAHGGKIFRDADDRRCCEAVNCEKAGHAPTGNPTTHTDGCITFCVAENKLLCGNASEQQDQCSVTIQADEPPGFVDKEKWLEHGGKIFRDADGRRCCEAVSYGRADCTQAGRTAAHTGRCKTVPTTPCAPLCGLETDRAMSQPHTAISDPFGQFAGDERKSRRKPWRF
jgi:hypothetical protein